jgi:hypothetical protein
VLYCILFVDRYERMDVIVGTMECNEGGTLMLYICRGCRLATSIYGVWMSDVQSSCSSKVVSPSILCDPSGFFEHANDTLR